MDSPAHLPRDQLLVWRDDPVVAPLAGTFRLGVDVVGRRLVLPLPQQPVAAGTLAGAGTQVSTGLGGLGGASDTTTEAVLLTLQVWDDPVLQAHPSTEVGGWWLTTRRGCGGVVV